MYPVYDLNDVAFLDAPFAIYNSGGSTCWDAHMQISYGYDGKVKSDDSDIEQDLNDTLNLNVEKLKRNRLEAWNHMRARIARKNLNEQIKMYTAFIEGEGQVNSDMKMEYAGFLLFMAGRELRKLKGKQKGLRR